MLSGLSGRKQFGRHRSFQQVYAAGRHRPREQCGAYARHVQPGEIVRLAGCIICLGSVLKPSWYPFLPILNDELQPFERAKSKTIVFVKAPQACESCMCLHFLVQIDFFRCSFPSLRRHTIRYLYLRMRPSRIIRFQSGQGIALLSMGFICFWRLDFTFGIRRPGAPSTVPRERQGPSSWGGC